MSRRAVLVTAASLIIGAAGAAGWLGRDEAPPVAAAEASHAEVDLDDPAKDAERRARKRRAALSRLTERAVGPTRTVKVRVMGCGLVPAPEADVTLIGAGGAVVAAGRANEVGVFSARVPAEGEVVAAAAAGALQGAAPASAAEAIDLNICPGATIEGEVVDGRGEPVADVTVTLGDGQDIAVTDENGEFVLTDLFLTASRVSATAEAASAEASFEPLAPFEVRALTLTLKTGRRLAGAVVDHHDEPVSYASVVARDFSDRVVARVRGDRSGRFWLRDVPLTPLIVTVEDGRGGVGRAFVAADDVRDDVLVRLNPAGMLTVDYVGPHDGTFSVHEASPLIASDPLDGLDRDVELPALAAVLAGTGASAWLPAPRTYWVVYGEGAERRLCGRVFLAPGEREIVACGEARGATLSGRLVDASGAPVVGARVMLMGHGIGRRVGRSDEGGAFRFDVEVDRTASVGLWAADPQGGYLPTRRRNIALGPGRQVDLGSLRLDRREDFPDLGQRGPFGGIGAMVEDDQDGIRLSRIVSGGPLDAAGVQPGDVVIAIGEEASGFLPARDAVRLLRGQPGSVVKLRIRSDGGDFRDVTVERAVIDVDGAGWTN